jgi:hypothetical protein
VIAGLASPLLGPTRPNPAHGGIDQRGPFGWAHSGAALHGPFGCVYSGARHEGPFRCVHGGAEPSGECTRSARDKRAAHCIGAAGSSPPGKHVDAHGRRRGAPGQNQKDSQASGTGDTRRDHRTAQQNEKSTPAFEGNRPPHQECHRRAREGVIESEARNVQRMRQMLSERRDQRMSRKLRHQIKRKCDEGIG